MFLHFHRHAGRGYSRSSEITCAENDFGYDYNNRLIAVQQGTDLTEYLLDASGARVGRVHNAVTNYFVIDQTDGLKRPLAETDASGTVTRYYVWAGMRLICHIDSDGTYRYYHSNELGSTIALTDASGSVTDQFAYMPYGYAKHTGTTDTPFQWLGGYGVYYDADTELHLTLYRAYSCHLKRFMQADPLGIDGGSNVYMMANLNPLWFIDPYGLCPESWYEKAWNNFRDNLVPDGQYINLIGSAGTGAAALAGVSMYFNNKEGKVGLYLVEGASVGWQSWSWGASTGLAYNAPALKNWEDGFISADVEYTNWKFGIEGAISSKERFSLTKGEISWDSFNPDWRGAKSLGVKAGMTAMPGASWSVSGSTYHRVKLPGLVEKAAWQVYNTTALAIPLTFKVIKNIGAK